MENGTWLTCPICGGKTRNQIRKDTVLVNYPLFCPKCKHEILVNVKHLNVTVLQRTDDKE